MPVFLLFPAGKDWLIVLWLFPQLFIRFALASNCKFFCFGEYLTISKLSKHKHVVNM